MKSNLFLRVIIGILTLCAPSLVFAQSVDVDKAVVWAEDKGQLLLNTFQEKDISARNVKLDNLFDEYVDVHYVAKFVSGRYWQDMNENQRQEYVELFRRYVKALYKTFPLDFVSRLSYRVINAVSDKNFVVVNTLIKLDADENNPMQDILLSFRLHSKDGELKLVDIKVAESSLLLSYRNKFAEMFRTVDGEISWFLEDLSSLVISSEKMNQAEI